MDQNKFINTYIDLIINNLLDYVKTNLQLQTQIKVSEFVVAEKDQAIAALTKQLQENTVAEDWKTKYEAAEVNYSATLNKVKHMDTLLAQIADMKNQITSRDSELAELRLVKNQIAAKDAEISNKNAEIANKNSVLAIKDVEIEELRKEIEILKEPKKVINTKGKKKDDVLPLTLEESRQEISLDDF